MIRALVASPPLLIALFFGVRWWLRDRREHKTILTNVADRVARILDRPESDTPPVDDTPIVRSERYRIMRLHDGRRYAWKSGDAELALRTWDKYLANPESHPGALEFWDGPHCRNIVAPDQR